MVCFTSHFFKFNSTNKFNWFNLLCKYYEGISINVSVDGQIVKGNINQDFFNSLTEGTNYEVMTEKFWANMHLLGACPTT